jgi:hypothetical protein
MCFGTSQRLEQNGLPHIQIGSEHRISFKPFNRTDPGKVFSNSLVFVIHVSPGEKASA